MMKFSKLLRLFIVVAIATFDLDLPVSAQTEYSSSNSSSPPCRMTTVDTPIFQEPSTSSNAIRILPTNTKVSLGFIPASGDRFVRIQSPISGFIQTAVLKMCNTSSGGKKPWDKPTIGTVCRRVIRPEAGLIVRREPNTKVPYITKLYPITIVFANLTTANIVKSYNSENYSWVEIDLAKSFPGELTGTGWIVNTNLSNPYEPSNLAYCGQ